VPRQELSDDNEMEPNHLRRVLQLDAATCLAAAGGDADLREGLGPMLAIPVQISGREVPTASRRDVILLAAVAVSALGLDRSLAIVAPASDKMMICGSHFPWPGLGKIARDGAGYALTTVQST